MSITIHYKGTLNKNLKRDSVVDVIRDIGETAGWSVKIINDEDKNLFGIILGVQEKCEPLPFLFDSDCRLRSIGWLVDMVDQNEVWISTKTHFAGIEAHIVIIKFLEFLKNNYISDLEVDDETEFWIHRDAQILKRKFQQMTFLINIVGDALAGIEFDKNCESIEDLVEKIEKTCEELF